VSSTANIVEMPAHEPEWNIGDLESSPLVPSVSPEEDVSRLDRRIAQEICDSTFGQPFAQTRIVDTAVGRRHRG
jgi:hypothetical protein